MTESAPAADAPLEPLQKLPKGKHRRKRSGTAKWHMSREAVDLSLADLHKLDEQECWQFFVEARFGSKDTIRCPYCGSIGSHYFRRHDRRWKCHGCGKAFTVTTGTIFAQRKLPLRDILVATLTWINSSAGQPALELKRHIDKTYNTAFTLQAKLREALMRAYNVGLLSGEVEMDGADQSGWQSAKKRGEPRGKVKSAAQVEQLKAKLREKAGSMTGVAQQKERDARTSSEDDQSRPFGHRQSENARVLISVRKRSGTKGAGAVQSRIAVGLVESPSVVKAVVKDFVAASESVLNSDSYTSFSEQGGRFLDHRTVNHSESFVGPNGESNNLAEELNFRYDRAEKGQYLNIEPKYLLDYAVEVAFRTDTRRLPNGTQLKIALNMAMSVGPSKFWRGFTHGKHRKHEILHPEPRPAPSSGPAKGRHPISSVNGRPPR